MTLDYWQQRWLAGRTGFHREEVNPNLRAYLHRLRLAAGDRILVPLSGKSVDIPWLAGQGYEPIGIEASELAVEQLFEEQGVAPMRCHRGGLTLWRGGGLASYVGDYFALTPAELGTIAAAWDRAALIALPADQRPSYAAHTAELMPEGAPLLLVTMAYADAGVAGPPYSVSPSEVASLYAPWFDIEGLASDSGADAPGPLQAQGVSEVDEAVWLLSRNGQSVWTR